LFEEVADVGEGAEKDGAEKEGILATGFGCSFSAAFSFLIFSNVAWTISLGEM